MKRKLGHDVVWQVIDKNTEKREAAEKIKSEVALHGRRMTSDSHQINPRKNSASFQRIKEL